MENTHHNKRSRNLLRVHKFLQTLYQKLQSYSKTSQQTQRKEEMEMGRRTLESIQRVEGKDYKSTSTHFKPIGKYRLKFFPKVYIACPCSKYPIETRRHILYECSQYNKSWNLKRESLKDVLTFLELNPGAFCFQDGIM